MKLNKIHLSQNHLKSRNVRTVIVVVQLLVVFGCLMGCAPKTIESTVISQNSTSERLSTDKDSRKEELEYDIAPVSTLSNDEMKNSKTNNSGESEERKYIKIKRAIIKGIPDKLIPLQGGPTAGYFIDIFIEDPVTNKEELLDIYSSEKIPESSLWYKSGCSVEFDMREEDFQVYLDKFTLQVPGAFFSTLKNIKFHCQNEATDSDN